MRSKQFFENLLQDIRYAIRMLRRSPGFTATAIAALALGIGANTAIFTVVNTVLLQPLAYPQPDRLVQLELSSPEGNANVTSIPKYAIWREQTQVLQDVAAYDTGGPGVNLTGGDRPEQLKGVHVSASFFPLFGASMAAAARFPQDEDRPGGARLVVLSNGLWRRRFAADPNIVGQEHRARWRALFGDGRARSDLHFRSARGYLHAAASGSQQHRPGALLALRRAHETRRHAGASPGRDETGSRRIQAEISRQPEWVRKIVSPRSLLRDTVIGDVRKSLLILLGAVGMVLLIACANVANLLLVRATMRKREIAIRAAMGAGRGRIIRQLLTESVLLSLGGGVFGLILGYFGVRALLTINPGNIPRIGEQGAAITLDWRVLAFTLLVSLGTGILFGLIPAFNASHADLSLTLKESGSRSGSGLSQNKARATLIVTEVALALVLLVGAALLIRTFAALRGVNPGFSTDKILTMEMSLSGKRFETTAAVNQLVRDSQRRVEGLPGVVAFASTCCLPLEGGFGLPFIIEGRPLTDGPAHGGAGYRPLITALF